MYIHCHHGVVANVTNCYNVVTEFELQFPFELIRLRKVWPPLFFSSHIAPLQFFYKDEDWYPIKQKHQTKPMYI